MAVIPPPPLLHLCCLHFLSIIYTIMLRYLTRSGKSSMMISLFRIQESCEGQILIDGIDTSTVPLHILRSRLGTYIHAYVQTHTPALTLTFLNNFVLSLSLLYTSSYMHVITRDISSSPPSLFLFSFLRLFFFSSFLSFFLSLFFSPFILPFFPSSILVFVVTPLFYFLISSSLS